MFIFEHAAVLALLLVVAGATGTMVMGTRAPLALRAAMGMAVTGQGFVLLGTFGVLGPRSIGAFAATAIAGCVVLLVRRQGGGDDPAGQRPTLRMVAAAAATLPLLLLALYPPIAFDETLYHLPFVQAIARSGAIRFLPTLRFPAFPQLHELLCVPAFLLAGDTATHLVSLAEVVVLAGILIAWPEERLTGFLAAALVLGNPIVIQVATVTYVEAALTLFIAAGFYCLDRRQLAAAGFLLGAACSVKYLGWYFAGAAVGYLLLFGTNRRRTIPLFLGAFGAGVLPMYARIVALSGNPFFPYLPRLFGTDAWTVGMPAAIAPADRIVSALRLFWDITFARERLNWQPPYSPLFALATVAVLVAARRDHRAAFVGALCVGYIAIFTFLPQDSRYLLSLLPLVSVAAAIAIAPALRKQYVVALTLLAVAPGLAYAGYRLARQLPLPVTAAQRQRYLEEHLPEYRAVEHLGPGRVYVCGAEQLQYFGGGEMLGEVAGPFGNDVIFDRCHDAEDLARTLGHLQVKYLLISRAHCPLRWRSLPGGPRFERLYADDGAELWRLRDASRTMPP